MPPSKIKTDNGTGKSAESGNDLLEMLRKHRCAKYENIHERADNKQRQHCPHGTSGKV